MALWFPLARCGALVLAVVSVETLQVGNPGNAPDTRGVLCRDVAAHRCCKETA